jgi:hypothetical protein
MLETTNSILNRSAQLVLDRFVGLLPGLLALLVILAITLVVAVLVRILLLRFFRSIELDRLAAESGVAPYFAWTASHSPSVAIAYVTQWLLIFVGVLGALAALELAVATQAAQAILGYLPHVFAAVLILLAGHLIARFVSQSVLISAVNMQIQSARLLALGVRWLVILVAAAMALEHLGIGRQILVLAFAILFGGIVLTLALAIGLGAKEAVRKSLERQSEEIEGQGEDFRHL